MLLTLLIADPLRFFAYLIALIFSISIHEFSHIFSAKLQGDDTGERAGRLTFNPFAHIDPYGLIAILLIGFGWGKPAPFNPYNLKNQRFGPALVALSGPVSNLVLIIIFSILLKIFYPILGPNNYATILLEIFVGINGMLMVFNLIPIPPLDGSHILGGFLGSRFQGLTNFLNLNGPRILLLLVFISIFFNISIFSFIINPVLNLTSSILGIPLTF